MEEHVGEHSGIIWRDMGKHGRSMGRHGGAWGRSIGTHREAWRHIGDSMGDHGRA